MTAMGSKRPFAAGALAIEKSMTALGSKQTVDQNGLMAALRTKRKLGLDAVTGGFFVSVPLWQAT